MTEPALTVGIPFHDEERHLGVAIRSILAQTFESFELLLVDDGSTDDSLQIARSFADPRIVVTSDGVRRGLPARLNEIVDRARAPLVARMDADDVVHPTRLEKQVAFLQSNADCDVVGTWMGAVDDDDVPFAVLEAATLPPDAYTALARGVLGHAAIVARREWFRRNRYDPELTRAEDRDLWARTAHNTRFAVLREPLYVTRVEARDPRFLEKYLRTQAQNRRIFLRHGPRLVGWPVTAKLCAGSFARAVAMRTASALDVTQRIVGRRGRPPSARETAMIHEALASGAQRA